MSTWDSLDQALGRFPETPSDRRFNRSEDSAFRQRLTDYAEPIPHHECDPMGENVEFISVRTVSLFKAELRTLYEKREVAPSGTGSKEHQQICIRLRNKCPDFELRIPGTNELRREGRIITGEKSMNTSNVNVRLVVEGHHASDVMFRAFTASVVIDGRVVASGDLRNGFEADLTLASGSHTIAFVVEKRKRWYSLMVPFRNIRKEELLTLSTDERSLIKIGCRIKLAGIALRYFGVDWLNITFIASGSSSINSVLSTSLDGPGQTIAEEMRSPTPMPSPKQSRPPGHS